MESPRRGRFRRRPCRGRGGAGPDEAGPRASRAFVLLVRARGCGPGCPAWVATPRSTSCFKAPCQLAAVVGA
eukprot:6956272-Alexandrium_andersonii.AAC.1